MGDDPPSTAASAGYQVEVGDEQQDEAIDAARLGTLASAVLQGEGVPAGAEMNLLFTTADVIAQLHAEHLGGDGPTDVLSFPIDGSGGQEDDHGVGEQLVGDLLVGDVVVCPAVARTNAAEHGVSLEDELALLVVHGTLHLLGHDHGDASGAEAMRERELRYAGRSGATAP